MVIKDKSQSRVLSSVEPRMSAKIIMDETCSLCELDIPDGRYVLRHTITKHILCVVCLVKIAEIK